MKRREFIALLGGGLSSGWSGLTAKAQQHAKVWRIGQVLGGTQQSVGHLAAALEKQLGNLGYVQGKNLLLINRFSVPQPNEMENAIRDILPSIELLVAWGTIGGVAAKKLAHTIPVVFMSVGAPVSIGLVESLSHPGGNITGISFEAAEETYAKRLQILKEIIPTARRVAVLGAKGDPNVPFAMTSLQRAAPALGATLLPIEVTTSGELTNAFEEMDKNNAEALVVISGVLTYVNRKTIADLAIAHNLPACHGFKETVALGGLVSLGPDLVAMTQQGAVYIDKIFQGTNPGDLPVQRPARYEVAVNLKTARVLGLTLPDTLLTRADEVIE
jgi:putative tryptophan/tyrosine transport system substrate-binding protein